MGRRARATAATLAAGLLLTAACGDDDSASEPAAADTTTTTTTAPAAADRYAERGPYAVGSTSRNLDDGRRVVVWYPADPAAAEGTEADSGPTDVFDIAALLSPEMQAQVPADARPQHPIDARAGAEPAADGPFPVVLFSHGFAGFPEQSADLTTHLASWGFVVAAPDHVERSLGGLLGTAAQGVAPREDAEVLAATLDLVAADEELADLVDAEHVAVAGHSAGAGATYELAGTDDRMDAFIAYSVGGGDGEPVPQIPGMVMLGTADGVIPADASRELYAAMAAPKVLVELGGAGHLVFSDICLIGADGGGVIAIAETIGLDLPEDLKRLGRDGCGAEATPPVDAFGAIDHLSVAFLRRHLLGDDADDVLDPAVTDEFTTVDVTVEADEG